MANLHLHLHGGGGEREMEARGVEHDSDFLHAKYLQGLRIENKILDMNELVTRRLRVKIWDVGM